MNIFIGTSGWVYSWNPDGLEWYTDNSNLNTVELNMSFYRFPYKNQVIGWARKSERINLRWSIKVNRIITHRYILSEKSYRYFNSFLKLFKPLEEYIDFYLIQLPPRYRRSVNNINRLKNFVNNFNLGWKLAIEFRDESWFAIEAVELARELNFTYVSVDSPEAIFYCRSGPYIYLRFHGRTFWYAHYYTDEELVEAAKKVVELGGDALYAYFNNNHDMLDNARRFKATIEKILNL